MPQPTHTQPPVKVVEALYHMMTHAPFPIMRTLGEQRLVADFGSKEAAKRYISRAKNS